MRQVSGSLGPPWGALIWHTSNPDPPGICSRAGSSNMEDIEGEVYGQEAQGGHFRGKMLLLAGMRT